MTLSKLSRENVLLTLQTAARTAFQNFAKRYMAEVDPKHAKKKEKYVKNRRRWARKDLVRYRGNRPVAAALVLRSGVQGQYGGMTSV